MTSLWVTNNINLTHRANNLLKTWQSKSSIRRQNTLKAPRASFTHPFYFKHCHPAMTTLEGLTSPAATGSSLDVHLLHPRTCVFSLCQYYLSSSGLPEVLAAFGPSCSVGCRELSKPVVLPPNHHELKPDEICRHELLCPSSFLDKGNPIPPLLSSAQTGHRTCPVMQNP